MKWNWGRWRSAPLYRFRERLRIHMANPAQQLVGQRIAAIEAEMKSIGMWQTAPLPPAAMNFHKAFGADTMAYSQWLQFVFIPRVNQIIAGQGKFPSESNVGIQGIREFDGDDKAANLVTLLCEFDALFR
jgi:uncharacterized protein YqcC (DUF446 family)